MCIRDSNDSYIASALAGLDDDGPCTAIGHARTLSSASAAFINGTAAHGEDFDDTFEGGPVHAGAVIVPAVLAACERHKPDGAAALLGIAVGTEVMCRLSTVVPKAVHKAGFHPTAIFGVMGAAAGVGAARRPDCAAQPGCSRLVQAPSARYSMMPDAKLPAMPSASTICLALSPGAAPTPAAAPITPKIAVGWKPALCTAFGTTVE